MLRVRWLLSMGLLALSACAGSSGTATPPVPNITRIAAKGATVSIVLPPIVAASPYPAPGFRGLASTTKSVTISLGKSHYKPVDLSAQNPNCSPSTQGLQCVVTVPIGAAKPSAHVSLTFYARLHGSGAPIALADQLVGDSHLDTFVGLAKGLTLIANPGVLRSGAPGASTLVTYGVDAAGGFIPNDTLKIGTNHVGLLQYTSSGPYRLTASATPFKAVYFLYDGSKTGVEKLTATPKVGHAVSAQVRIEPLPSPSPEIFAGITPSYAPAIATFPESATGNVAPVLIPMLNYNDTVFSADAYNGVWVLSSPANSSSYVGIATRYSSGSGWLESVPVHAMTSAAIDASGNLYAAVTTHIEIFASGLYARKLVRSIDLAYPAGPIAVDGSGNVYVGNYNKSIDEYAAGVAGKAPPAQVFPTGATPYQLAADAGGDVFADFAQSSSGTQSGIWEYPAGTTIPTQLLGGLYVRAFAIDQTGTIYASVGNFGASYSIEIFPPGATTPSQVISGTNTELALPAGIAVTP